MLALDVAVPWMLMRVLAVGGLGVLVWELFNQKLTRHNAIEESISSCLVGGMFEGLSQIAVVSGWDGFAILAFATSFSVGCIILVASCQVCCIVSGAFN
jgi:hypothetical protein